MLMVTVWWPYMRWANEQLRQAHAAGIMVNAPELNLMLPVALAVIAGWSARKLERNGPWWWLLRVILELTGLTVLIGLVLAVLLTLMTSSGRPRGAEPELVWILLLVAFLAAIRPVRWLERQRTPGG